MIYSLLVTYAFAAVTLPGEAVFEVKHPQIEKEAPAKLEVSAKPKNPTHRKHSDSEVGSNLPPAYLASPVRESTQSELVQPPKGIGEALRRLRVGEKLSALVDHSVIAFPDEKSPVVANLTDRKFKGIKLIGESSLEPNSHRVFLNFTKAVVADKVYSILASGLTPGGQPGFMGEYHSREAELFAGDFLASFVAGYFDGTVPRHTNALGQLEVDTSVDSAMKKGLSAGAMSTADGFREKLKKVPEFSEIKGPIEIDILILEQGQEKPRGL
jgi:hypothetical protein